MQNNNLELSYEFFPPRTDVGKQKLANTQLELAHLRPEFYSVTFGAGGSTRDNTLETVLDIQQNSGVDACPHLTCVGATNKEILELVQQYHDKGIHRLVLLRGDPPGGMVAMGECKFAADLVQLIREHFNDHFTIAVASYPEAHPDAKNLLRDVENLSRKMAAGANMAITQYFYNADSYYNFVDICRKKGITQPIIPGIMPVANFTSLKKFSNQCGAEIPRWMIKTMDQYDEDIDAQRELGLEIVTSMCEKLIQYGAPGFHFYTMNQAALTRSIINNLNILK